jgi:FKBP12-rapamycin complex-associated protein
MCLEWVCEWREIYLDTFRRETIRVLGLLGALDPYKHKMNLGQIDSQVDSTALLSITDNKTEAEASHGMMMV